MLLSSPYGHRLIPPTPLSLSVSFVEALLYIVFTPFQYYEMSYGLNVEMHKQVRDRR